MNSKLNQNTKYHEHRKITRRNQPKVKVSDVKIIGNTNLFRLLCKASSVEQGWMKSSKAMEVATGCVVQVTTQQKNPDGSYSVAEALVFVPDVKLSDDVNGGSKLV